MNRAGTLHGGMISTLVDSVGSLAVASKGLFNTGISTDIHATFVRPGGRLGDTVSVLGEVVNIGTFHALIQARHWRIRASSCVIPRRTRYWVGNQTNAAYGSHTKYVRGAYNADHVVFDAAGEKVIEGVLPKAA